MSSISCQSSIQGLKTYENIGKVEEGSQNSSITSIKDAHLRTCEKPQSKIQFDILSIFDGGQESGGNISNL